MNFLSQILRIVVIDLVLSGDNAVVIGMAAHSLEPRQRKQAIILGGAAAIGLRVALTAIAAFLLRLRGLQAGGGLLLLWIAVKLLKQEEESHEGLKSAATMKGAIATILVADFIMSLDNVLGVAAAAKGSLLLLVIGLGLSIPLIVYGSTLILKLMNRFPAIVTVGGGVLGWVAGEMAIADPIVGPLVESDAQWLHGAAPMLGAIMVIVVGTMLARSRATKSPQPEAILIPTESAPPPQEPAEELAPPGYHWVRRSWRTLPDGTRDYAVCHGQEEFKILRPLSSKLREPRH
jgi:YjbE family integral membrane protein